MLHRSFKPAKCKTSCKLATSRLKLMKNKKGVLLNQMKRDLAQLLESGQDQTARIRVEHVIREEKMIAAYDLVEIYCELIVARMPIIESQKNCPIDLKEAIASVIFASPRCADIPELLDIRKHLTAKYGKEFTSAAVELRPDCGVSRMLIEKLSAVAPDGQTKIKVLKAIAEEHNIEWEPKAFGEKDAKPPDDLLNGPTTFEKASTMYVEPPKFQAPPSQDQKHDEPTKNYEQNIRSSTGSQNFASTDAGGNKVSSGASHPDVRPDVRPDMRPEVRPDVRTDMRNSGMGSERREVRQSFHGDGNAYSAGRQNWSMDFKDATSAAQAAAESAELASMAARAAAELSSQGRITRQYSSESRKTSTHDLRDERHGTYTSSNTTGEQPAKATMNRSSHDRNPSITRQHSTESHKSNSHGLRDERLERNSTSNLSVEKNPARDTVNHSFHHRNPNITRQYSTESQKSNIDGLRDERPGKHASSKLTGEHHAEDSVDNSFHDRSPKLQNERMEKKEYDNLAGAAEKFYSDGHRSAKRSSRSSSSRSSRASIDDDTLVNSIPKGEGYSRKSSFEEEATKGEKGTFFSEMSMKKQSRESDVEPLSGRQDSFESGNLNPFGEERIEKQFSSGSSRSRSRTFSNDYNVSNSKNDTTEDPFVVIDHGSIRRDAVKTKSYDDDEAVAFDEYSSDESSKIDIGPTYDEVESTSYFPSPDRKPPTHSSTDTDAWSPKRYLSKSLEQSTSPPRLSAEWHSPVMFSGSAVKSVGPLLSDDFGAATLDYSDGPKFDSEDEFETSRRSGRKGSGILAEERNSGSDRKSRLELNDVRGEPSVFNPINSFLHEDEENVRMPESSDASKDNEFHSISGSESGKELKFGMLTGGLRNKGYRQPPFTTPSTDASSSFKKSAEGPGPIDLTAPSTVRSSFNSRESRNADEKLRSTVPTAVSDSDSDDSREEFPQQNLTRRQEPYAEKANKEVNTKSSLKSRVTSFDLDSADSTEDLRKQTPANRSRLGSGLSRRTKATPSSSESRVRLGSEAVDSNSGEERKPARHSYGAETQPEPRSQTRSSGYWGGHEQPSSEQVTSKPLPDSKTPPHEGSFNTHEPRSQTRTLGQWGNREQTNLEKHADPKPSTVPKTQSHEGRFKALESRSQTRSSDQLGNRDQPGSENQAASKQVTEPKIQSREGSFKAPEPRSHTRSSGQLGNRDQPGSEKQAVSKPVTEPKIQSCEETSKAPEPWTRTRISGEWGNRDKPSSVKQATPKPVSEPKTESHEGSSKASAGEPPSRARLAANRTEKQPASKPTHASIPSREGRSEASASTVASKVAESPKKSSSLTREDSTKNASHVHPKLPDYDTVFAQLQALRDNRK